VPVIGCRLACTPQPLALTATATNPSMILVAWALLQTADRAHSARKGTFSFKNATAPRLSSRSAYQCNRYPGWKGIACAYSPISNIRYSQVEEVFSGDQA